MSSQHPTGQNTVPPRRSFGRGMGLAIAAVLVFGIAILAIGQGMEPSDGAATPEPGMTAGNAADDASASGADGVTASDDGASAGGENGAAEVEVAVPDDDEPAEADPASRAPVGPDVFPADAAPLVPTPDAVRGIYLNAWAAGSSRKRAQLIKLADETEINTFVIDVKEAGEISYRSGIGLAKAIGADRSYIRDVRGMLAELREHGIYPIARIVVFKDPVLAQQRPEWAIQKADGSRWRDNKGKLWVDPYNREVWDYNIALAREAVLLGFSEVQWDYVRFPDVPQRYMETAVYPAMAGRTRARAIREFLAYSREKLADLGVPVTADVFGLTVSVSDDMGIGQNWEQMTDVTDALLPMVYPSHFAKGSYGIPIPNADPYQTVKTAMEYAVRRSAAFDDPAEIRPWLQDFSLGWPKYGPAEVRAQIQAVYDAGLTDWILWNPGSRYTVAALAPEGGEPPLFPIPRHSPPAVAARDSLPVPRIDGLADAPVLGVPVMADSVRRDTTAADRHRAPRSP